jgi:acyl-coenzyme A thioesterase PaaI-like protein
MITWSVVSGMGRSEKKGSHQEMIDEKEIPAEIREQLEKGLRNTDKRLKMPPPVFAAMQGRLVGFDPEKKILQARFPVLPEQLNPYGSMQGGMIAAAIDNTLGPLSMLVAPPNFTRRLEIKYRQSVTPERGDIMVEGRFVEQKKRQLFFRARVLDQEGNELANAKAVHWIVDEEHISL